MRAFLTLLLISIPTMAWAPPIPLFDFIVDDQVVRERQDEKTCGLIAGFYARLGVEGQCERRV